MYSPVLKQLLSGFPEKKSNSCWPREPYLIWVLPRMSASLFTTLPSLSAFPAHWRSLFPTQVRLLFAPSAWSAWTRASVVGALLSYRRQLQYLLPKEASPIARNRPSHCKSVCCLFTGLFSIFPPLRDRFPDSRDLSV